MQPRGIMIRTELHPPCHIQMIIIPDPQQKGEIYIRMTEESLIFIVKLQWSHWKSKFCLSKRGNWITLYAQEIMIS